MKQYYLPYDEKAAINYGFLLCLYKLAAVNKKDKINSIIEYRSLAELSSRMSESCGYSVSAATLNRNINSTNYKDYFTINKAEKIIILNNNFRRSCNKDKNKFVVLNDTELDFLLQQNNKLLYKYYLYLKYYCGYTKSKQTDSTANQILTAIGYSQNSGAAKEALCKYNTLLEQNGFIKITRVIDKNGYNRNVYTVKY